MSIVNETIVDIIQSSGIDMVFSVPCKMLSGILVEIDRRKICHVPVCREEEGIGVAAGAALAGRRPMILMQNSGLGNCINALMSLTRTYKLPLFILMSHRGGRDEKIMAQVPMGEKSPLLLKEMDIDFLNIKDISNITSLKTHIDKAFIENLIKAAFLAPEVFSDKV